MDRAAPSGAPTAGPSGTTAGSDWGYGSGRYGGHRARRRIVTLCPNRGSSRRRAARRGDGGLNRPVHGRAPAGARARCKRDGQNEPQSRRKSCQRVDTTWFHQSSAPKKKTPTARRRCLAVGVISPIEGGLNGGRTPSPIPDRREPATSGYTSFIGRKTRPLERFCRLYGRRALGLGPAAATHGGSDGSDGSDRSDCSMRRPGRFAEP